MFRLDFAINASLSLLLLLLAARPVKNEDPDKWVWSKDNGANNAEKRQARYEVFENQRPYFPKHEYDTFGVSGGHAEIPRRPDTGYYAPDRSYGIYGLPHYGGGDGGNFGIAPGRDVVIVKGSSYRKRFNYYDTCRCTERFNCNSNGVAYGECDVGKQYCCHARKVGPPPSRPVHSAANGVLVGPNGPYDNPVYSDHGNRNEVLVGPGGPTGQLGGAGIRPGNGVLIGPGGPFDSPYNNIGNLYARSRKGQ
ncbi:hypothetical protein Trydic_g2530 [Trypoxylus dichotomus]